jgi:hypothetical protein
MTILPGKYVAESEKAARVRGLSSEARFVLYIYCPQTRIIMCKVDEEFCADNKGITNYFSLQGLTRFPQWQNWRAFCS